MVLETRFRCVTEVGFSSAVNVSCIPALGDATNAGVVAANGASITLRVPSHTTFDATSSDPAWTCDTEGICTLALGDVAAGQGGSTTFAVIVDADLSTRVRSIYATVRSGTTAQGSRTPTAGTITQPNGLRSCTCCLMLALRLRTAASR